MLSMLLLKLQNRRRLPSWAHAVDLFNFQPFIQVQLPKFRIDSTHETLKIALQTLGLKSMFGPSADFSGISSTCGLYVDCAIQKAFIQVCTVNFQ